VGQLTPSKQFLWGLAGGGFIAFGQFLAWKVPANLPWPNLAEFGTALQAVKLVVFLLGSGLAARMCDPHHPLAAAYEGAYFPTFFYFFARHLPEEFKLL